MCYDEKVSEGSKTFIVDSMIFFCPPLGLTVTMMLNSPMILAFNFKLIFLFSSPFSLNLLGKTYKLLFASIEKTIGVFERFLKSIKSSKACPK
jgi:hypothetical protein